MKLLASVGKSGTNSALDVKLIQALLNVNLRKRKSKGILNISGLLNEKTQQAISNFQSVELKLSKPDGRIDPGGRSFKALLGILKQAHKKTVIVAPLYGVVTWRSEGAEGGPYHSRKLHVPSSASGLTIGRGYDLKTKSATTISLNLSAVFVDVKYANLLAKASRLHGEAAKKFIVENDLLDFEISADSQLKLFKVSYDYEFSEVKRICLKKDTENLYGEVDWESLNPVIKDIVIDLKFRGDYTSSSRKIIQKHIANNDLKEFEKAMVDQKSWASVPSDRFNRRKQFLEKVKLVKPGKSAESTKVAIE